MYKKNLIRLVITLVVFTVLFGLGTTVFASGETVTWNPDDKGSTVVLSNDNLTASMGNYENGGARATKGVSSGKWYWEVKYDSSTPNSLTSILVGVANFSTDMTTALGNQTTQRSYYSYTGKKCNGTALSYGSSYSVGDVVGIALDMDNGTITFYKNGVSQGTAFSDLKSLGTVYPFIST